ncbi:enoyl-CoA hydratase-related protein, partial [Euryarchaeota archaeon]|nr:enoyl-CoA hydratase-related protein [Euryarchaeota archaeon]
MTITVEHLSKGVSLVTLSAETSRNGLNMESMKSMSDIMGDLLEDSSIKSIIMTGSGKFFCSGADID